MRKSLAQADSRIRSFLAPHVKKLRQAGSRISSIAAPIVSPLRSLDESIAPIVAWFVLLPARVGLGLLGAVAWAIDRIWAWIVDRVMPALGSTIDSAGFRTTPGGVGAALAIAGSALLIGSQFLDLRGVAVGAPLYQGRIASDVPTPITETELLGPVNLWLMIPVAVAAAVLALGAGRGRRRKLGVGVGICGAIAIATAIVIDLPTGLDPTAALPYSDASVRLLGGFWAQIGAGLSLILAGVMILRGDQESPPTRRLAIRPTATVTTSTGNGALT